MIERPRKRRPQGAPLDHSPEAVTRAREEKGFTKRQVARACGFSEQLMCDIEAGRRNATPEKLTQLAKVLECPEDALKVAKGPGRQVRV